MYAQMRILLANMQALFHENEQLRTRGSRK